MKAAQMADKQAEQGKEFGYGEESGELTVSFFPGTTLRSKEVENVKVGTRVFDTPGLPTKYRVTDHVSDFKKLKHILMTKEPSLTTIRMDAGGALWIGGLARLDLISGPSVAFIPYVSSEVSLARYTIGKANVNYIKGFGKELFPTYGDSPSATAFEKYTIKTKVNMKHGVHMEEIAIFGLGSITIRQLPHSVVQGEEMHLELYLPKGVGWTLRPPLIGPQEANSAKPMKKVVKKHGADTIEYLSRLQES